jgi:hypothetical protein
MAQYNRNNWHHIPGIGGIMATGLSNIGLAIIMGIYFNTRQDRLFKHHLGRQKTNISDVL